MKDRLYITDFNDVQIDPNLHSYYIDYFKQYYHDSFEVDKGTEIILDLLNKEGISNNWLDLGAGSTTLFWAIPMRKVKNIECNDVNIEALKVLFDFSNSSIIPECYNDVISRYGKDRHNLHRKINNYHVFNVFEEWPRSINDKYDLITEFGTFGQAKSEKEFIDSFMFAEKHLSQGGKLIGANWIRKRGSDWKFGMDNKFITKDLIKKAAENSKMQVEFLTDSSIKNDELYSNVFVFMLKKILHGRIN